MAAGGRSATLAEPSRILDVRAGRMMPVVGVAGPGTAGTDAVAAQHLRGGPANAHPTPENCGRLAFAERRQPSWVQVGIAFGSGPAGRPTGDRLVGFTFRCPLEDPGDFGQEVCPSSSAVSGRHHA